MSPTNACIYPEQQEASALCVFRFCRSQIPDVVLEGTPEEIQGIVGRIIHRCTTHVMANDAKFMIAALSPYTPGGHSNVTSRTFVRKT